MALYLLAIKFAKVRGKLDETTFQELLEDLKRLPAQIEMLLSNKERIQRFANRYVGAKDVFFIGRGIDYAISMEGSLKLKEISYIHSDAYASGELKHGPIALIENGTVVISICTNPEISNKLNSNVKEVLARGAVTVGFTSCLSDVSAYGEVIELPQIDPMLAPLPAIIPLQLLAYYVCTAKGFDVDKPRNLAKSVTVE